MTEEDIKQLEEKILLSTIEAELIINLNNKYIDKKVVKRKVLKPQIKKTIVK